MDLSPAETIDPAPDCLHT